MIQNRWGKISQAEASLITNFQEATPYSECIQGPATEPSWGLLLERSEATGHRIVGDTKGGSTG